MATETIDFSNGGTAVVILPKDQDLESEFSFHKQILPLSVDQVDGNVEHISKRLPPTTKVVLLGAGIPNHIFQNLHAAFRKRNLTYISRNNQQAINDLLHQFFPKKLSQKTAVPSDSKIAPKGTIQGLVKEHADLSKGAAEEGRRLFQIAQEKGISTTLGSITQAISLAKRKAGRGDIPKSALSPKMQALRILDEAIENLNLIRDYVQSTEEENNQLKHRLETVQKALGMK